MLAAVEGSKEMAKVLLKYKPSLTAVDSEGYNPLFLAATNGNFEVVKLLVEQPNPQINVKNNVGSRSICDVVNPHKIFGEKKGVIFNLETSIMSSMAQSTCLLLF